MPIRIQPNIITTTDPEAQRRERLQNALIEQQLRSSMSQQDFERMRLAIEQQRLQQEAQARSEQFGLTRSAQDEAGQYHTGELLNQRRGQDITAADAERSSKTALTDTMTRAFAQNLGLPGGLSKEQFAELMDSMGHPELKNTLAAVPDQAKATSPGAKLAAMTGAGTPTPKPTATATTVSTNQPQFYKELGLGGMSDADIVTHSNRLNKNVVPAPTDVNRLVSEANPPINVPAPAQQLTPINNAMPVVPAPTPPPVNNPIPTAATRPPTGIDIPSMLGKGIGAIGNVPGQLENAAIQGVQQAPHLAAAAGQGYMDFWKRFAQGLLTTQH